MCWIKKDDPGIFKRTHFSINSFYNAKVVNLRWAKEICFRAYAAVNHFY